MATTCSPKPQLRVRRIYPHHPDLIRQELMYGEETQEEMEDLLNQQGAAVYQWVNGERPHIELIYVDDPDFLTIIRDFL